MPVEPILTLGVAHAYGDVAVLTPRPVAGTAAALAGYGLGLRPRGGRLLLYRERDGAGRPRAALLRPLTLRFVLDAPAGAFAAVTDLAVLAASPAPLFSNAGTAVADRVALRLVARAERASETIGPLAGGASARVKLAGRPDPAAGPASFQAPGTAGAVAVSAFDAGAGVIELTGAGVAAGASVTLAYPVLPRRPAGSLAEIEIVLDQALIDARGAAGPAAEYVVALAARSLRWCYYVVAPSAVGADAVTIGVGAPPAEARGLAFTAIDAKRDLTASPDAADPLGRALVARQPGGRRVLRFLADRPVAMRDRTIRQITLDVEGKRQFENLPNPSPEAVGALRAAGGGVTDFTYATIAAAGGG